MERFWYLSIISIFLVFTVQNSQGVRCFQCAYIEGVQNRDMNSNCVSNVKSTSVHSEEGIACVTAKGEIDGKSFVVRRAFYPGAQLQPKGFPKGQKSLKCDDPRLTPFGVPVTSVSDRKVDKLTSCTLCNERDDCNGASHLFSASGLNFILIILIALLCY